MLDGDTGIIVPIDQLDDGTGTPKDPEAFVRDLAEGLTRMVSDPDRAREMGRRGRQRAVDTFSWEQIGRETVQVYESLLR